MDKATPENLQKAQTYIDFVKDNLEPLAQQLKVSVEWLWQILVMQARVEAIVLLALVVGGLLSSVSAWVFFAKVYKRKGYKFFDEYDANFSMFAICLAILVSVIASVMLAANMYTIVTGLVNPEFRAIEKIVEYAKPAAEQATQK